MTWLLCLSQLIEIWYVVGDKQFQYLSKDKILFFLFLLSQLLGQTATAAPTTTISAQSPLSETNPPSLSPNGGTQPGALSPGALSQTSQNAGTAASLSNGAGANSGASNSATTCCENGRPIMVRNDKEVFEHWM
jgi:hypothetical protein